MTVTMTMNPDLYLMGDFSFISVDLFTAFRHKVQALIGRDTVSSHVITAVKI